MIPNLKNLINTKYLIEGKYVLEEKQEKDFPKTKVNTTGKTLLYKFDEDKKLFPFFQEIKGAKSMADYVFFVLHKDIVYVFITELSTANLKTYQRKPTMYFIEYIEKTVKRLCTHSHRFEYRYLILSKKSYKKTTKPSSSVIKYETAGVPLNIIRLCI
ncbi:MAG: hypothetical protein ACYDCN_12525 [Bacteroidia bacterium]